MKVRTYKVVIKQSVVIEAPSIDKVIASLKSRLEKQPLDLGDIESIQRLSPETAMRAMRYQDEDEFGFEEAIPNKAKLNH